MRARRARPACVGVAWIASAAAVIGLLLQAPWLITSVHATDSLPSMPIISRSVPAYSSSGTAASANSADYSVFWATTAPIGWLAYDLSSVAAANRAQIVVAWYNDPTTSDYWQGGGVGASYYNIPTTYTIEANAAPGGAPAPSDGWVTLVDVTANVYNARMHTLDFTGYNWLRMNISASENGGVRLKLDVHDASATAGDAYLMLGDSITAEGAAHSNIDLSGAWRGGNLAQLIAAQDPAHTPSIIDGGTGGVQIAWSAKYANDLLAPFSGHYVALNLGTNDANQSDALSAQEVMDYYTNMLALVDSVQARGMVAIVPHIPWGCASGGLLGTNAKLLNDYVDAHLYTDRPGVVRGPDLWTYFYNHQSLLRDCIHPTYTELGNDLSGYEQWQRQWRDALLSNVYGSIPVAREQVSVPSVTVH